MCLSELDSRLHFEGMKAHERRCDTSKMDTRRQVAPGLSLFLSAFVGKFQTSLNVARDTSANADASADLGLLIQGEARD
jgi:hypothetical protein